MKVEIWHDSVAQEIDVLINDVAVDKNDIFGFLYPVRNYPLQTWLYPDGSWKGLEYQLIDLARENTIELIFHGRKIDFDDVKKCLENNSQIQLEFVEWDICQKYDELLGNLINKLEIKNTATKKQLGFLGFKSLNDVEFPEFEDTDEWSCHIETDNDLIEADENKDKRCCYVHDTFFTSYEKLKDIQRLTRSLRMPRNAIYCCFDTEEKKDNYFYYAQSVPKMNFTFCLESEDYKLSAKTKYGAPSSVRWKIKKCSTLLKTLHKEYTTTLNEIKQEYGNLAKKVVNLNVEEKIRFENIRQLCGEFEPFIVALKHICDYIDILFSVSKENKEEVFHYECIDVLYEKTNDFLKMNCGV